MTNAAINIFMNSREDRLRQALLDCIRDPNSSPTVGGVRFGCKEAIRAAHGQQRETKLESSRELLRSRSQPLLKYFASGREVDVANIRVEMEVISGGTRRSDLFRLASLSWSIPVSDGFGRRIRYLVWDATHENLIGIIALGDPVYNLKARDAFVGWDVHQRKSRLSNVLDAYVLGAVPPYSFLLGGKLVACLIRTSDVARHFRDKYAGRAGVISGVCKNPELAMVTTTSALGRSSVYNRLKLGGQPYFSSVGYSQGWGHFHIPDDLFAQLREYLRHIDHPYVDGHTYGSGPNWKLRTIKAAMSALGINGRKLAHGVQREVFVSCLASNAKEYLRGEEDAPDFSSLLSVEDVVAMAKERWLLPRSRRMPEYRSWTRDDFARRVGLPIA
jgi:hypothetical protein